MMPIRIAEGWSRDDGAAVSLGIRYFTRPGWKPLPLAPWSHTFLVFEFPDGTRVIHEALLSEGWSCKNYAKLDLWLDKDRKRHHAEVHWLPIPPDTVEAMYRKSCGWLGIRSYASKQIVSLMRVNCLLGRFKRWVIKSDTLELICSEGTSRILAMAPGWDLRKTPDDSFDGVSPQETYIATLRKLYPLMNGALGRTYAPDARQAMEAQRTKQPTCEACDATPVRIHHIIPVAVDPSLEADPNNLASLCAACHVAHGHAGDKGCRKYVPNLRAVLRARNVVKF